ncbi:unnamed protein product [Paramecium octaurelia]|uniref:Uncharacterized protein n=1 Tax=Paramecium octaurelia TaxID=43137 RepID=A0A8S1YEJ2_PAROT|nr:unnamed protein product [Paramecium octaurelia]
MCISITSCVFTIIKGSIKYTNKSIHTFQIFWISINYNQVLIIIAHLINIAETCCQICIFYYIPTC